MHQAWTLTALPVTSRAPMLVIFIFEKTKKLVDKGTTMNDPATSGKVGRANLGHLAITRNHLAGNITLGAEICSRCSLGARTSNDVACSPETATTNCHVRKRGLHSRGIPKPDLRAKPSGSVDSEKLFDLFGSASERLRPNDGRWACRTRRISPHIAPKQQGILRLL